MARLEFCVDEHVPQAYQTALTSNGFTVVDAASERNQHTEDRTLLEWCVDNGWVLLTNDRDFVNLHDGLDHAGIVIYTDQSRPAGAVARAIRRVDRQFGNASMANTLIWLAEWL